MTVDQWSIKYILGIIDIYWVTNVADLVSINKPRVKK